MRTSDFDFALPEGSIALRPAERRDGSRLLVINRDGTFSHCLFSDLAGFLAPGDMLLMNNSKVFPARLTGVKPTGGKVHLLLVRETSLGVWEVLMRERYTGRLSISNGLSARVSDGRTVTFDKVDGLKDALRETGLMPLPPYIRRMPDDSDRERYQTVYAETEGSIAAPTAGLHFTRELLERIEAKGVLLRTVTLHVGTGTFKPVKTEVLKEHQMDEELFEISPGLIEEIASTRERGNRLVAVGTTTTRAIEGFLSGRCRLLSENGVLRGSTDIFIHEGYKPCAVDSLITNFHLPKSTPLMLTAVFAGRENLLRAYASAVARGYRFFSYGDAMLVL